jgi:hypothetical protein
MTRELSTRQGFTSGPIPRHLQRLPLDPRGFPVPHVSEWTDENPEANERRGDIRFGLVDFRDLGCPYAEVLTLFPKGEQGKGAPRLAKLHPVRQRECLLKRICSVCGQKASPDETLAFIGVPRPDGRMILSEPGMHRRCTAFAVFACPGINRDPAIVVAESRSFTIIPESYLVELVDGEEQHTAAPLGEWVPRPYGYLRGLMVLVPAAAPTQPLAAWRDANAHLLDSSGRKKARRELAFER